MSGLPSSPIGLELELELRRTETVPLERVRERAESLLSMDVSDDLTRLGIQANDRPAVPTGADELVIYYEKQLATTQLVQHRLEKQYHQLAEEKLALETSSSVQTAALQQQLVVAREKADRVFAQATHTQQQVHDAHTAVGEIVDAVTHLAELLDRSGATTLLTHSFGAIAHSTQRTFQAVKAAQEGAQMVLELQLDARDACLVSPLLTTASIGKNEGTDVMRRLEDNVLRLRRELDDARKREQELEAEVRAAQLLFSGLEAEVISLQHDQAQAAAKLQLSQEELLAARDELVAAQEVLAAARSPAAGALTQGLTKLDAHITSVRNFLEALSMPQPPAILDALASNNLQLPAGWSGNGNIEARSLVVPDNLRASLEPGTFLRQPGASPHHQLRALLGAAAGVVSVRSSLQGIAREASLHDQFGGEQTVTPERFQAADERHEAKYYYLRTRGTDLTRRIAAVVKERDVLRSKVEELASRITSLETEKESLLSDRAQQLGMAAAAGAAGAAAAVMVAADATTPTGSSSPSQSPSVTKAAGTASLAGGMSDLVFAALEERLMGSEYTLAAVAAERDAALQRADSLADELKSLHDLLRQGVEGPDGPVRLLGRLTVARATANSPHLEKKLTHVTKLDIFTPSAGVASDAVDLPAIQYPDIPLAASPLSPTARPSPGHTRTRRSGSSMVSDSRMVEEAGDLFSEQGESFRESSHADTRSSTAVQSSYQSFTSEAPLVPTRRYTDDSQPHTYLLNPTEPLEGLLPAAAVEGAASLIHRGDIGVTPEVCCGSRRSCSSRGGYDTQSLLADVEQLQAAVCSLLISKAVACTEMQAESKRNLAALQAAHHAEIAKLQEEHRAEIVQVQGLVTMADVLASASVSQNATVQGLDKSTSMSDDGLLGTQYETELLQHSASLEVQILEMEERQLQLIAGYEARMQRMQAELESKLSNSNSSVHLQSEPSTSPHIMAIGGRTALQHQVEDFRQQCARQEAVVLELRKKHSDETRDQEIRHADHLLHLQAQLNLHEEEKVRLQAVHEEDLASLRIAVQRDRELRKSVETEKVILQQQVSGLREELTKLLAEHEIALAALERLNEEVNRHRTATAELQRSLEDCEGELLLRESLTVELRGQLQELQSEKEVEVQSFQSLLSTKAWMTEEIRSLQSSLKEASAKLAIAEANLAEVKARGASGLLPGNGSRLTDEGAAPPWPCSNNYDSTVACANQHGVPVSCNKHTGGAIPGVGSPAMASTSCGEDELLAGVANAMVADQLAEAAIQAALAECQLETLQVKQKATLSTPAVTRPLDAHTVERTDLMVEMVLLQGELDELRSKHSTLESKLEGVADELAYAVVRASLAELQLEQLRLARAIFASRANTTSQDTNRRGYGQILHDARSMDLARHVPFTSSNPEEFFPGMEVPGPFGSDEFVLNQQARQLYKELRTVRRALGELMVADAVVKSSACRQVLTTVWEAAVAAQDRAANLARSLQQRHQLRSPAKHGPDKIFGTFSGDEQAVDKGHDRSLTVGCLQSEMARARDMYCDTPKVYEMLLSDANEINSQLWRWGVRLHKHLSATEAELTRAQVESMPGPQLAFESLLGRKEVYVRSMEGQVSELQAGLQAAHSQILNRDSQVATLQNMMVQLSEQITAFEDVVVQCEVLSADLVSHSGVQFA